MNSAHQPRIVFFGSSQDSVIVLNKLLTEHFTISCIVTQPARPVGREKILTKTPVHQRAEEENITVLHFNTVKEKPWLYENASSVVETLQTFTPDLFISASYGQLIPWESIEACPFGGINVHPSLLPRWRGADPTPWTLLANDHQTGVSIVTLSQQFDEGIILNQKKIPVSNMFHSDLRKQLFILGADLLVEILPEFFLQKAAPLPLQQSHTTYARRLQKLDGYIPWEIIESAMKGDDVSWDTLLLLPIIKHLTAQLGIETAQTISTPLCSFLIRSYYALHPWPGLWTLVRIHEKEKRMKILEIHPHAPFTPSVIQLEGKTPAPFTSLQQFIGRL